MVIEIVVGVILGTVSGFIAFRKHLIKGAIYISGYKKNETVDSIENIECVVDQPEQIKNSKFIVMKVIK